MWCLIFKKKKWKWDVFCCNTSGDKICMGITSVNWLMGLITVRQYQHETKVHAKHLEIGEGILRLASRSLNLEYFEIFPLFGLSQWRHFTCLGQCGGVWCRTKRGEGESKLFFCNKSFMTLLSLKKTKMKKLFWLIGEQMKRTKPETIRVWGCDTDRDKGLLGSKDRWRTNYSLLLSTGSSVFGHHIRR